MDGRRNTEGFTIIELLFVIFIFAILAGLAAPSMARGIRQSRMNSAAAQVATALKRARSLAITNGSIYGVRVVPPDPMRPDDPRRVLIHKLVESDMADLATWESRDTGGGVVLDTQLVVSPVPTGIFFMPDGSAWGVNMQPPPVIKVKPNADYIRIGFDDSRSIRVGSLSGSISIIH